MFVSFKPTNKIISSELETPNINIFQLGFSKLISCEASGNLQKLIEFSVYKVVTYLVSSSTSLTSHTERSCFEGELMEELLQYGALNLKLEFITKILACFRYNDFSMKLVSSYD